MILGGRTDELFSLRCVFVVRNLAGDIVMTENKLDKILRRRGIDDAEAYLMEHGEDAPIRRTVDGDVQVRGNVQLMMGRVITRLGVKKAFARLRAG